MPPRHILSGSNVSSSFMISVYCVEFGYVLYPVVFGYVLWILK